MLTYADVCLRMTYAEQLAEADAVVQEELERSSSHPSDGI
jgi:hypothetical protein